MPNPVSLISGFPPDEINQVIQQFNPKKLHIYVDVKNVLTSLFIPDVVQEIIVNSQTMNCIDSSIFQSMINFASWWKKFANFRNLDFSIFFCTDIGVSEYHKRIYKRYKENREICTYILPVHDKKLKEIRDKNFRLAEMICNRINNVYFLCLKNLEADFLPHFLISRRFLDLEDTLHIICGNDKDMYQSLLSENVISIYKKRGIKRILSRKFIISSYMKTKSLKTLMKLKTLDEINPDYITAIMSIVGDAGDDIPGVPRIGNVTAVKMFSDNDLVKKYIGTPQELNTRVITGGKFFLENGEDIEKLPNSWKLAMSNNDIVTTAYKLISFEALINWLEKSDSTEKMDRVKYIDKILNKENIEIIPSSNSFLTALRTLEDWNLSEDVVNRLFI